MKKIKKIKEKKKEILTVTDEVRISEDIILEKGDKIQIIKEGRIPKVEFFIGTDLAKFAKLSAGSEISYHVTVEAIIRKSYGFTAILSGEIENIKQFANRVSQTSALTRGLEDKVFYKDVFTFRIGD